MNCLGGVANLVLGPVSGTVVREWGRVEHGGRCEILVKVGLRNLARRRHRLPHHVVMVLSGTRMHRRAVSQTVQVERLHQSG